jgi:hypothetical protein
MAGLNYVTFNQDHSLLAVGRLLADRMRHLVDVLNRLANLEIIGEQRRREACASTAPIPSNSPITPPTMTFLSQSNSSLPRS